MPTIDPQAVTRYLRQLQREQDERVRQHLLREGERLLILEKELQAKRCEKR